MDDQGDSFGLILKPSHWALSAADALLARWPHIAGPERVESAEELRALPEGSLIFDDDKEVGRIIEVGRRICWIDAGDTTGLSFVAFPVTVLYRPDATNPEEGAR